METEKLSGFLGDCRVFTIPGRTFPVTCTFGSAVGPKDTQSTAYIKEVPNIVQNVFTARKKKYYFNCDPNVILQVVRLAFDIHTSEMAGDILVFLTGNEWSYCPMMFI